MFAQMFFTTNFILEGNYKKEGYRRKITKSGSSKSKLPTIYAIGSAVSDLKRYHDCEFIMTSCNFK